MRLRKLLLAVAGATVLLGAFTSSAFARNFSFNNQQLRAYFREVRFNGLFGQTNCELTLEGSLHSRTIAKIIGQLIGYITAAHLGPCVTGTATVLTETLPWHVRYANFVGVLPNITRIDTNTIDASIRVRTPEGASCLSRSTVERPAQAQYNRGIVSGRIRSVTLGGTIDTSCGFPGTFASDNALVFLLFTTALIIVRLI
ncbi:MAG TPA: hypothetical protein VF250_01395 [Conexibacter sp.]